MKKFFFILILIYNNSLLSGRRAGSTGVEISEKDIKRLFPGGISKQQIQVYALEYHKLKNPDKPSSSVSLKKICNAYNTMQRRLNKKKEEAAKKREFDDLYDNCIKQKDFSTSFCYSTIIFYKDLIDNFASSYYEKHPLSVNSKHADYNSQLSKRYRNQKKEYKKTLDEAINYLKEVKSIVNKPDYTSSDYSFISDAGEEFFLPSVTQELSSGYYNLNIEALDFLTSSNSVINLE